MCSQRDLGPTLRDSQLSILNSPLPVCSPVGMRPLRALCPPYAPLWQGRFGSRRLPNDAALLVCSLYVNMNPIRAGIAATTEEAEFTSTHARLGDRMAKDSKYARSGWLAPVHVDGDGYDGVSTRRRASNKGYLGIDFREYLELLDALTRREQAERAGGVAADYPAVLERLGVSAADWERAVRLTSRRFGRELELMAAMFAEGRRRG